MTWLALATGNAHKVDEIRAILGPAFEFHSLKEYPTAPKTVEDGATFEANSTKKAVELAKWLATQPNVPEDAWVLADDSGLEVDALNGAPGVHSARFANVGSSNPGNSKDSDNNAKLLKLLESTPASKRTARFRCVLALTPIFRESNSNPNTCLADLYETSTQLFSGACEGRILSTARGGDGFGYDPLFVPNGFDLTFAELGAEEKNKLSHRSKALALLKEFWRKRPAAA
ncbi:MAG TPA: RdgB/HAM1 family non-canonical purine NTP pyrophosphatase [Methylomirabilota bacterium]|nr:RdgB/HAM1 family non-canonical purine NTP pyrophosphatase [Methylomirabilota bacterium]